MAGMNAALLIVLFINFAVYAAILVGIIALEGLAVPPQKPLAGADHADHHVCSLAAACAGYGRVYQSGRRDKRAAGGGRRDRAVIYQEQRVEQAPDWTLGDTAQVGLLLLVGNIPTFVLLGAYYIGREKLRREKAAGKDEYTGFVT